MAIFGQKPLRANTLRLTLVLLLVFFNNTIGPWAIERGGIAYGDSPPVLLVFGDSLVAGYGLASGQSFPDALGRALEGRANVINGGVSGDTTAGGASRIDWALGADADAVIVVMGGNDALRGLPPDAMEANLDAILAAIQSRNLPVLLAGMKAPANMGTTYGRDFDTAFANALAKAQARGGVALFYPFFLDGVALNPRLNQSDGIHPNLEGVAEITRLIMPYVVELLENVENKGGDNG